MILVGLAGVLSAGCHSEPTGPAAIPLKTPTCGASALVSLSSNQATTLVCTNGTFVNLAGGARYLIVPQFATGGLSSGIADTPVAYQIGVPTTAAHSVANFASPAATVRPNGLQSQFDARLRNYARAAVRSPSWRKAGPQGPRGASGAGAPSWSIAASSASIPPLGSTRQFYILSGTGLSSTLTNDSVVARLNYIGNNILMYIDTLAPANGFSASQLQSFGQYFDQVLYGLDVNVFGPPSDVDQNARVIMLLSPKVNALTPSSQCATQGYVAGYFDGVDLTSSRFSNQGEIFYAVVPDPNGTVSCKHTVSDLLQTVPATFLHELQHLISFSQHAVIHGGNPEDGWLDEGMSIRAEELGSEYFEAKYPPPSGRTDPSQLFPDSSQGFIQSVLLDSYTYLLRTDTASLTLHDDSENGFSWRGGDWLLVHWLGDLKGKSIFATMEQSRLTGLANISVAAGESFSSLFGDFSLALWTDSLVGVPRSAIPARDRFQTRNLRQLYQRLFDTAGGDPSIPRAFPAVPVILTATGAPVAASMVPGTMAFYMLDLTGSSSPVAIQFSTPTGTVFSTTLAPQVSVYRLP